MKITPPLAPPGRKAGTITRLFSGIFLGGLNVILLLFTLGLYVLPQLQHVTPVQLYHQTWETAAAHAYDPTKLKDWPSWEHKYDAQIKTDEDAIKYANEMLASTGDHYASLLAPLAVKAQDERSAGKFGGIGVGIEPKFDSAGKVVMSPREEDGPLIATDSNGYPLMKEVKVGAPAMQAGMKDGDAIVSIDGTPFKNASIKAVMEKLRGKPGELIDVVIMRDGKTVDLKITRGIVKNEVVTTKLLTAANGTRVGYIRLGDFVEQDAADEMAAALNKLGTDKIILDLRYNPGGDVQVCLQMVSLFLEDGRIVSIRERATAAGHELSTFSVNARGFNINVKDEVSGKETNQTVERLAAIAGKKQIIILVNGHSASAAEMFTGALKDNHRATVIGERTFGKGIGQSVIRMPNNTSLHITSLRYFTPSGKWLGDGGNSSESYGIDPDFVIKLVETPATKLGSDNDNQLSFALTQISK